MKVTFIMHSCFAVEIGDSLLLFDYFDTKKTPEVSFQGKLPEFSNYQKIFVFSTHGHRDHFWLESLKWGKEYPNMIFFLGNDIKLNEKYLLRNGIEPSVKKQMITIRPNEQYEVNGLQIQTFDSTDMGVSILVFYQRKTFYHAGDLNDWSWEVRNDVEYDENYRRRMHQEYQKIVDHLKGTHIDAACVVMDKRLGEYYKNGIDYFIHTIDADVIFPMHMWQRYDLIKKYKNELIQNGEVQLADKIMQIERENQEFKI